MALRAGESAEVYGFGRRADARRRVYHRRRALRPPGQNKPTREELGNCRNWLAYDFAGLPQLRVVLSLGAVAHDSYLELLRSRGHKLVKTEYKFAHGALHTFGDIPDAPPMLGSYQVSQQNTNTGRLTPEMFDAVLGRAKVLASL